MTDNQTTWHVAVACGKSHQAPYFAVVFTYPYPEAIGIGTGNQATCAGKALDAALATPYTRPPDKISTNCTDAWDGLWLWGKQHDIDMTVKTLGAPELTPEEGLEVSNQLNEIARILDARPTQNQGQKS